MTDGSGAIVAQYAYSPFGEVTKLQGSGDSDFGYGGYYVHARSGLNLTLFRAYSPVLGRWLSRDPVGEIAGSNLYAYVGNNPISLVDPFGLMDSISMKIRQALMQGNIPEAMMILNIGLGDLDPSKVAAFQKMIDAGNRTCNNFSRGLTKGDLGITGALQELQGSISYGGGVLKVRIDMIRGEIGNPFSVVDAIVAQANRLGANAVRIEGTLANERLLNIMSKRYNAVSAGATDAISIPINSGLK